MAKYTNESWIEKAIEKYGDRFSYDKTNYIDSYHKVIVKCNEHDVYITVSPITFIRPTRKGNFCIKCKHNNQLETTEFIERVSENFPHITFEKTIYKNFRSNVILTCKEHGDFEITAKNALRPDAHNICPSCISYKNSINTFDLVKKYTDDIELGNEQGVFYKLLVTHKESKIQFIKIGITSKSTKQRYKSYKDFDFEVLEETFDTNLNVAKMEREYKKNNKTSRFYLPKDIIFGGRSECYELDDEYVLQANQVKFIRESLLNKQGGICPICENKVEMPTLDHYHSKKQHGSGLCRGVICNTCNRMTGLIENNLARNLIDFSDAPIFLRNLADYLLNKRENYIHPSEKPRKPTLTKRSYNKLVKIVDGKQKVPPYKDKRGNLTKPLERLFEKYSVEPEFKKS